MLIDWVAKDVNAESERPKKSVPTEAESSKDEIVTNLESDLTEDWENKTLGRWFIPTLCWDRHFKREMDNFEWWR